MLCQRRDRIRSAKNSLRRARQRKGRKNLVGGRKVSTMTVLCACQRPSVQFRLIIWWIWILIGHLDVYSMLLLPRCCWDILIFLADHLITSSDVASRLRLRSANRHQLIVPRCRLNTYSRRAFSIAGPTVWNSLPDELRDPACGSDSFKQFLKTILFSLY